MQEITLQNQKFAVYATMQEMDDDAPNRPPFSIAFVEEGNRILQILGNSTIDTVSQKLVTDNINRIDAKISELRIYSDEELEALRDELIAILATKSDKSNTVFSNGTNKGIVNITTDGNLSISSSNIKLQTPGKAEYIKDLTTGDREIAVKQDIVDARLIPVQSTGQSITAVMSQKATSDAIALKANQTDLVAHTSNNAIHFTANERTKLANIEENAEVNVQSDWNSTTSTSDSYIKNKPVIYQSLGDSETGLMSQDAVTSEIDAINNTLDETGSIVSTSMKDIYHTGEPTTVYTTVTRNNNTTYTRPVPVATNTTGGYMPPEAVLTLEQNVNDILLLKTGIRVFYDTNNTLVDTMTSAQVQTLFATLYPSAQKLDGISFRNLDGSSNWTWSASLSLWVVTPSQGNVGQATNTDLGIVKGSTLPGRMYVETDGSLSLNNYDGIMAGLANRIESSAIVQTTAGTSTSNIPSQNAINTALNAKQNSLTAGTGISIVGSTIASTGVLSVNGRKGDVVLNSSDVNLQYVNNTSDLNKPISNATQDALDDKADLSKVIFNDGTNESHLYIIGGDSEDPANITIGDINRTATTFLNSKDSINLKSDSIEINANNAITIVSEGVQLVSDDYEYGVSVDNSSARLSDNINGSALIVNSNGGIYQKSGNTGDREIAVKQDVIDAFTDGTGISSLDNPTIAEMWADLPLNTERLYRTHYQSIGLNVPSFGVFVVRCIKGNSHVMRMIAYSNYSNSTFEIAIAGTNANGEISSNGWNGLISTLQVKQVTGEGTLALNNVISQDAMTKLLNGKQPSGNYVINGYNSGGVSIEAQGSANLQGNMILVKSTDTTISGSRITDIKIGPDGFNPTASITGLADDINPSLNNKFYYTNGSQPTLSREIATLENVPITVSNASITWTGIVPEAIPGFTYRGAIAISGVTTAMMPVVSFSNADAESGKYSPRVETYNGGVYIYGNINTLTTIPKVVILR